MLVYILSLVTELVAEEGYMQQYGTYICIFLILVFVVYVTAKANYLRHGFVEESIVDVVVPSCKQTEIVSPTAHKATRETWTD